MAAAAAPAVGFVGIGNMGWPMAAHIAAAGFDLRVFDVRADHLQAFVRETGARAATGMADIAGADVIVTMLPTGSDVAEALTAAEDAAFVKHARAGTIVVDMSSSEPTGTRALGEQLAARGITLLDAPVSGAVPRAQAGTLTIMIGGNDRAAIEQVKPVLESMGSHLFETGPLGTGHAVKALNNLMAAGAYAVTAEACLIADRFGLDRKTLIDIVNVSTGQSFITTKVMPEHVLNDRFATGFQLGLLAKDVRIAAELSDAVGVSAPVSHLVCSRWAEALAELGFRADHSEAIKAWGDAGG